MNKTPCRNRFSRFTAKVHLEDRIRELEANLDRTWTMAYPAEALRLQGAIAELQRLLKHWKLEKT